MQSETADFAFSTATWKTGRNILVFFDSGLFRALYENMTSTTKSEIRKLSHCCQRRNEPWPQVTCIENLMKFGHEVFEICKQTDKQTDRHVTLITILRTPTGGEVTKNLHIDIADRRKITNCIRVNDKLFN